MFGTENILHFYGIFSKYNGFVDVEALNVAVEPSLENSVTDERMKTLMISVPGQNKWQSMALGHTEDSLRIIVYFYDSLMKQTKLNESCECVGIFNYSIAEEEDEDEQMLDNCLPKEVLLPRLHVICSMSSDILNIVQSGMDPKFVSTFLKNSASGLSLYQKTICFIKEKLIKTLSDFLGGDSLAAHFLLLHLISRVHTRKELFAIGHFPINISGFPATSPNLYVSNLFNFINRIVEKSKILEISVPSLESTILIPTKNYINNELEHSSLQLAQGTHLLLDETKLKEGSLSAKGLKNVQAIMSIATQQSLNYDFTYQQIEFQTNIPVLVCSTSKSIFKDFMEIKLSTMDSFNEDVGKALNPEDYKDFSQYIMLLTQDIPFHISAEVSAKLQEDFVNIRQKEADDSKKSGKPIETTGDSFHSWLNLARLYGISLGKTELEIEDYFKARDLELSRLLRLKSQFIFEGQCYSQN